MAADLLSAMVARSKQAADPIATAYASGNRPFTVTITRPGARSSFDRDAAEFVNPADDIIYSGPARIWTVSGGVDLDIGDERMTLSNARASIDAFTADNAPDPALFPRVDDVFTVVTTPQASQTHLVGRVFAVGDVEAGGHFGLGFVMSLTGVAPSRRA